MANEGIADIFLEIADLLDLQGEKFKPEAYRRAARTLQMLPEDVAELVRSGRIDQVPGIGEALSQKVREYVATGQVPYLEKLRSTWPPGLLALMRLDGVGPKTTRRFFLEFQVQGSDDLQRLIDRDGLRGVAGFGPRKVELLRQALIKARTSPEEGAGGRRPLPEAQALADEILTALRAAGVPFEQACFAGSLRRRRETVGDLDLLVTSTDPAQVSEAFLHLSLVEGTKLSGGTKTTVVVDGGFQVDLRVVPPASFGAALQYFTGSKDHNVHLRSLAIKLGLKVNEYGLSRGSEVVASSHEEELYRALGLAWVPPEMRENQGEVEAASRGALPAVVQDRDLRGELHIHLPASAEPEDLREWVEAAKSRGWDHAGFVVTAEDLAAQGRTARELRQRLAPTAEGVRVWLGVEIPWDLRGVPERPAGADFLALRLPETPAPDLQEVAERCRTAATETPALLTHLSEEAVAAARIPWRELLGQGPAGLPLELAVSHQRVELETSHVREAREARTPLVLSGRPRLPDEMGRLELAAGVARRGWVDALLVRNTQADPWSRTDSTR